MEDWKETRAVSLPLRMWNRSSSSGGDWVPKPAGRECVTRVQDREPGGQELAWSVVCASEPQRKVVAPATLCAASSPLARSYRKAAERHMRLTERSRVQPHPHGGAVATEVILSEAGQQKMPPHELRESRTYTSRTMTANFGERLEGGGDRVAEPSWLGLTLRAAPGLSSIKLELSQGNVGEVGRPTHSRFSGLKQ